MNGSSNALVIEGGAMRSVFSAGLLDGFLKRDFNPFELYMGVSAGASNLAIYLTGEEGRGLELFLDFAGRRDFISLRRFLRGGHLLDLRLLMDAIEREGIDLSAITRLAAPFLVCTTDVRTGQPRYIDARHAPLMPVLEASMALPLIYRDFPELNGRPTVDGGMSDAIPLDAVIARGARRIMVIRSRPAGFVRKDTWFHKWMRWKLRHHPQLVDAMRGRTARHHHVGELIQNPPPGIGVVDICPPEGFRMGRFSTDRQQMLQGYRAGLAMADEAIAQWHANA